LHGNRVDGRGSGAEEPAHEVVLELVANEGEVGLPVDQEIQKAEKSTIG